MFKATFGDFTGYPDLKTVMRKLCEYKSLFWDQKYFEGFTRIIQDFVSREFLGEFQKWCRIGKFVIVNYSEIR